MAAVIDPFSRRIVGWLRSATMTAQLATDALMVAIWRRGKSDALLHHSDQGSQYTSEQFQRLMADNGVTCAMRRITGVGLPAHDYGTHLLRRTKAALVYKRTGNLRAVQILLGHTKIETTVRHLGVDIEDALTLSEHTEL